MERTWSVAQGGTAFRFTDVVWFAPKREVPREVPVQPTGRREAGELSAYAVK